MQAASQTCMLLQLSADRQKQRATQRSACHYSNAKSTLCSYVEGEVGQTVISANTFGSHSLTAKYCFTVTWIKLVKGN